MELVAHLCLCHGISIFCSICFPVGRWQLWYGDNNSSRTTTTTPKLILPLNFNEKTAIEPEPRDMTAGRKDHSIHIQFCVSWGSRRNYQQVKGWLEGAFPELRGHVTGGNYPPPPIVELISNFLSVFQLLGIINSEGFPPYCTVDGH